MESTPNIVPTATSIRKKKAPPSGKQADAVFIVRKYVKDKSIIFSRDMGVAYKLLAKYPERSFWKTLDCKFKVDNLFYIWTPKVRDALKNKYRVFKARLEAQKNIAIPDKHVYPVGDKKIGSDYISPVRKPRSVIEFCK